MSKHMSKHMLMHACPCMHVYTHVCTHAHVCMSARMCTCMCTHMSICARLHKCRRTGLHTCPCTHVRCVSISALSPASAMESSGGDAASGTVDATPKQTSHCTATGWPAAVQRRVYAHAHRHRHAHGHLFGLVLRIVGKLSSRRSKRVPARLSTCTKCWARWMQTPKRTSHCKELLAGLQLCRGLCIDMCADICIDTRVDAFTYTGWAAAV